METSLAISVNRETDLVTLRANPQEYPRVIDSSPAMVADKLKGIINMCFMLKGQAIDSRNVQWMADELTQVLLEDAEEIGSGYISFEELRRVIRRDILAEEQMGINVASLYKIIRKYIKGEGHEADAKAKQMRKDRKREEAKEIMAAAYAGAMLNKLK